MTKTVYAVVYDGDGVYQDIDVVAIFVGREALDEYLKQAVEVGNIDADDGHSVYEFKRCGSIKVETRVTFGE